MFDPSSCLERMRVETVSYEFHLGNFDTFYNWKVGGCWKLVYSTITILGSRRTKLGLRDFISLGDFYQNIDVAKVERFLIKCWKLCQMFLYIWISTLPLCKIYFCFPMNCMVIWFVFYNWAFGAWYAKTEGKAVNVIEFNVRGLNLFNGRLTIVASFKKASKSVKALDIPFCLHMYHLFTF